MALICNVSSRNNDDKIVWRAPTIRVVRDHFTIPRIGKNDSGTYSCALLYGNNTIKEQWSDEIDIIVFCEYSLIISKSLAAELNF